MGSSKTTRLAALALSWGLANGGCGTVDRAGPDLAIEDAAQPVTWSNNHFGIYDAKNHEKGWLDSHDSQWEQGDYFATKLSQSATKLFDDTLASKKERFEDDGTLGGGDAAYNSLEYVDLFFTHTHGSVTVTDARWAMWNRYSRALSSRMRLGDDSRGLSVFASVACNVLRMDGNTVQRWEPVFMGTLRIALGSHDSITCSNDEEWIGWVFADRLQQDWSIKAAWHSGMGYSDNDNDSSVLVTGTTASHCWDRMDHMSWYNLHTYKRLGNAPGAEGIINAWCQDSVTNG